MQVQRGKAEMGDRVRRFTRQRPLAAACCALALCALAAAIAFGAATAPVGVQIERGGGSEGAARAALTGSGTGSDGEVREAGSADPGADGGSVVVDVGGTVERPGVVELAAGDRVADAIAAAGGLAADADTSALNQAAPVTDGQKVLVPRMGEEPAAGSAGTGAGTGAGAVAGGGSATSGSTAGAGLVNVNTATEAELDELPGVGPSTARAIIEEREANGPFRSVDDLMRVSGIGERKLEKLKGSACV